MKSTTLLLAAAAVLGSALLAAPRGAMSGDRTLDASRLEAIFTDEIGEVPPPVIPSIFDSLQTFTGRVTFVSATSIGNYVCKDATIKLIPATGVSRVIHVEGGQPSEENANVDALLLRSMPAKVTLNTSSGPKIILIPQVEAERFKAILSILHAAKLTNKDVTISVPTVSVPNCPAAFFAADITFN